MPRKEFEAFTRLDASDVNSFLMDQTVMSFAGTAARGSAIATPVEGMVTYLADADRLDFFDGSSYVPASGLNFIKNETFTAVSSVSFNNIFSSTYKHYLFLFSGVSSEPTAVTFRLRSSGSDNSTANYYWGRVQITNTDGPSRVYNAGLTSGLAGLVRDLGNQFTFTVSDPASSTFKTTVGQGQSIDDTVTVMFNSWNNVRIASSFDGITFTATSGNFTGTITAYGYRS
jgi:hypothetical protein